VRHLAPLSPTTVKIQPSSKSTQEEMRLELGFENI